MKARLIVVSIAASLLLVGSLGDLLPNVPELPGMTPVAPEGGPVASDPRPREAVSPARLAPTVGPPSGAAVAATDPAPAPSDALLRFMVDASTAQPATRLMDDLVSYYHNVGFPVPDLDYDLNEFDENETVTFTFNVGDVDGDGVDDVAMDTYCTTTEGCVADYSCGQFLECIQKPPTVRLMQDQWCRTPHRVFLMSGVNGTEIWRRDMSMRSTYLPIPPTPEQAEKRFIEGCFWEIVVGQIPSPDGGSTLLVYRFQPGFSGLTWDHTVYALDRLNGQTLWTSPTYTGFCLAVYCENALVNPILQVPPEGGVQLLSRPNEPSLFLQGVGWRAVGLSTPPAPTENVWRDVLSDYQPIEWAARINLENGQEYWHKDTFTPNQKDSHTSVLPRALPEFMPTILGAAGGYHGDERATAVYYWNYVPCCFDLTGDGVPDMVYATFEWNNQPSNNQQGPYTMANRLVAFDGGNGAQLWETIIAQDIAQYQIEEFDAGLGMFPYFQLLGDADGDGVNDILVHRMYFQFDFFDVTEVYHGQDGKLLWRFESARQNRPLVLGDADKDGGNDVLLVDWFDWHHRGFTTYDYNNVTAKPLVLLNGRDGHALWRGETFSAPTDLAFIVLNYRINGVPDLNGDGAGEFPADNPVQLGDLTIVHRWSFLNAVDGTPLRKITTVGQFSIPTNTNNVVGDARDDLGIITGDIADLWISMYDGATGEAAWSRRIMTPHLSEYIFAQPLTRYQTLHHRSGRNDSLLNFHFIVTNCGGFYCTTATNPQVASYAGLNGTSAWAYPAFWDENLTFRVVGATPATFAFHKLSDSFNKPVGYAAASAENSSYVVPGIISFAMAGLVCFGLGRRSWK